MGDLAMKPKQLDLALDAIEEKMARLRKLQQEAMAQIGESENPAQEIDDWLEDQLALWTANKALDEARAATGLTQRQRELIRVGRKVVKQRLGIAA